ncbi:MAG: DUF211 domain-containing protein [Halobacteriaceae archaeon]
MTRTRRLVLDVLKPHDPAMVTFANEMAGLDGVSGVNAVLLEVDEEVENVKLTVEGDDVDLDTISGVVGDLGGTIHSVDQAACGDELIEESETPQD